MFSRANEIRKNTKIFAKRFFLFAAAPKFKSLVSDLGMGIVFKNYLKRDRFNFGFLKNN